MKAQDCNAIRREIEETDLGHQLSMLAASHVRACNACQKFYQTDMRLRQLIGSLALVEAPADFDFRLRARLAQERRSSAIHFSFAPKSLAIPSVAVAALLLLAGSVFVLRSFKSSTSAPSTVAQGSQGTTFTVVKSTPAIPSPSPVESSVIVASDKQNRNKPAPKLAVKRNVVALAGSSRTTKKDSSSTAATVVRRAEPSSGSQLTINLPVQTLKVSVDDGSGNSRTISFPTVSFGSDRVLTRNGFTSQSTARTNW